VLCLAYTSVRTAEAQGLEVRDITLTTGPDGNVRGSVRVQRTKDRRAGPWVTGTPKSKRSRRTVPLPPWLATKIAVYLADTHPRAAEPTAPLWPNRRPGGPRYKGQRAVAELDWAEPCDFGTLHSRVLIPALEAVGLPASRPQRTADDGTVVPGTKGVRLHDLRHTFAALQLSACTHFMQVSKWLGHASFVVTMTVYADWIPDEDTGNTLPEPVALAKAEPTNVVSLFGQHRVPKGAPSAPFAPSVPSAPCAPSVPKLPTHFRGRGGLGNDTHVFLHVDCCLLYCPQTWVPQTWSAPWKNSGQSTHL
jgi:integrase